MTEQQEQLIEEARSALNVLDAMLPHADDVLREHQTDDDESESCQPDRYALLQARGLVLQHQKKLLGTLRSNDFMLDDDRKIIDMYSEGERPDKVADVLNHTIADIEERAEFLRTSEAKTLEELHGIEVKVTIK